MKHFSPLYAIVDRASLDALGLDLQTYAADLRDAGVRLLQYRDKVRGPQPILRSCAVIADIFRDTAAKLILNDRADLAALAGWGVHVGQDDLPVHAARVLLTASEWVGVSTHTDEQVMAADGTDADYIAIGPVFSTTSKTDAEPVVGLEGVRRARALTKKPLVAIGGITAANARNVIAAGADCMAVIGALLPDPHQTTRRKAEELLAVLGT